VCSKYNSAFGGMLLGIASVLFLGDQGVVLAADSAGTATASEQSTVGENSGTLEEVIVTARRRSEDLQEVPISIASLSSEDLQVRGIANVEDLTHAIANFSPAPYNFFGTEQGAFRMRGLPSVGVYVDGIAYQEEFGYFTDLVEMDRVEVLRGPQGTLFGKNSMGGAIQFITKEPSEQFGARVSATVGDYHRFNISGAMDIPLSSTLLTKITVAKVTRDGYLPSVSVNQAFGSQDDLVARLDVLWKPTDHFNARFIIEQNDIGTNGNPTTDWGISTGPGSLPGLYDAVSAFGANLKINPAWLYGAQQKFMTAGNYDGPELHTRATNYKLILNDKLNDHWALKALGSARDVQSESYEDFTNVPYHLFDGDNTNIIHEATAEGQLLFNSESLTGTTGFYYYNDFRRWRRENWLGNELNVAVNEQDNTAFNKFLGLPPGTVPFAAANIDVLTIYHIHGYAGFTEWTYKITNDLSLTAGVRYNRDTAEVGEYNPNVPIPVQCCAPNLSVTPLGGPQGTVASGVYKDTAPRASLQYQWTPAIMTYATYAEGFSAGGGSQAQQGAQAYQPEKLFNYEVGLRSDWFEHTLRVNTSLFYSQYTNVQANENIGLYNITINAGHGLVKGAELEGQWLASRSFSFNYSAGYLNTGYSEYPAASGILPGAPFPFAPRFSANGGAQFDTPLPNGAGLTARVDEGWTSWVKSGSDASGVYIPSYGLLGSRLIYHPPGNRWDVQLYGSNLLNKFYRLTGYNIPGFVNTGTVGLPRMWGLTVNARLD
jgi:iron complex outermembrane receptor protein